MLARGGSFEFIHESAFRSAFLWASIGLAISFVLGVLSRFFRDGRAAPVAGLAIAAAGALTLYRSNTPMSPHDLRVFPDDLRNGLLLLALAGILADVFGRPVLIGLPLAIPGALLIGRVVPSTPSWSDTLTVVVIVIGGACVASFDFKHSERGLGPVLFAISAAGVYVTVPDTEHALILLGAALPLALSSWPFPMARLGSGGAFAATGLLAWTAAVDGVGRETAIIGAAASLGLLVAEPVARALRQPRAKPRTRSSVIDRLPNTWWAAIVVGVAQFLVVCVTARVAGLRHELRPAVFIASATIAVATIACALATRVESPGDTSRTRR